MARNVITYISNIGKSVVYSSIDQVKSLNPAITSFYEDNQEAFKTGYNAITHLKKTIKDTSDQIMNSPAFDLAKKFKDNAWEDLKTGKLYNMERVKAADKNAAEQYVGADDDFDFGFDDDSGDFGFDDEDTDDSNHMMDLVGKKSSEAISKSILRSSEYVVKANQELAQAEHAHSQAMFGQLSANMGTINTNIGSLIEYANGPLHQHITNSTTFYETQNNLTRETNTLLKELLELEKNRYGAAEKRNINNDRITMSSILGENDMPDLSTYLENIKKNLKAMDNGTSEFIKMMTEDGMGDTLVASPLQFITNSLVKKVIPDVLKTSMKSFNKTISGAFATTMAKLSKADDFGVMGYIKNILGVDLSMKKYVDTGSYEKGPMQYNGLAQKSIVEVIPTYLAKITAAVSGEPELRYNFKTGRFVKTKDIRKAAKNRIRSAANMANLELTPYLNQYTNQLQFDDPEESKQFKKDLEKILLKQFKDGEFFNAKTKSSAASYGLKGAMGEMNFQLIKSMFEALPKDVRKTWYANMARAKDNYNSQLRQLEYDGSDIEMALYNGSIGKETKVASSKVATEEVASKKSKKKKNKEPYKKKGNRNIVDYLSTDGSAAELFAKDNWMYDDDEEGVNNSGKLSIIDNLLIKGMISAKTAKMLEDVKSFASLPANTFASLIQKADESIYNLLYGTEEENGIAEMKKKGIFKTFFDHTIVTIDKFGQSLADHVINPLKEKVKNFNFGEKKDKFAQMFGFDNFSHMTGKFKGKLFGKRDAEGKLIESGFFNRMGSEAKRAGGFVKNTFKGANRALNSIREKNPDYDRTTSNNIDSIMSEFGIGKIGNAAEGIKKVQKTGIVAVSKGEMIIPPDMNPNNIRKRYKEENKAKSKFLNTIGEDTYIGSYAEGGEVEFSSNKFINAAVKAAINGNKKLVGYFLKKATDDQKTEFVEILNDIKKRTKEYKSFGSSVANRASDIYSNVKGNLSQYIKNAKDSIGMSGDDDSDIKELTKVGMESLKDRIPETTISAILGAGISGLTGMIGGPLLGAAVGSAISLVTSNDKLKQLLFGSEITDENGNKEYTGGRIFNTKISNAITKYVPSIGKGSIIGAITSLMPFVPGGPVAGIILGGATGFAVSNEKTRRFLFGEDDERLKKVQKVLKDRLPSAGVGAAAGLIAGPFGVAGNLLLGSAIGFASSSETFKSFLFGEKGDDGKRHGGLVRDLAEWSKDAIVKPLQSAFDPFKKQGEVILQWFKDGINNAFKESIGTPLQKWFKQYILNPAGGFAKGFIGGILKPFKFAISLPFKAIGAVGDNLRARQIRKGNADYMFAEERLAHRNKRGFFGNVRGNLGPQGRYYNRLDENLAGMDYEQLNTLYENLDVIEEGTDAIRNRRREAANKYRDKVSKAKGLDYSHTNAIKRITKSAVKKASNATSMNDVNKILDNAMVKITEILNGIKTLPEDAKTEIAQNISKYMIAQVEADGSADLLQEKSQVALDEIKSSLGANFDLSNAKKIKKLVSKELTNPKFDEILKNNEESSDATNELKDANGTLTSIGEHTFDTVETLRKIAEGDEIYRTKLENHLNEISSSTTNSRNLLREDIRTGFNAIVNTLIKRPAKGIAKGANFVYDVARDSKFSTTLFGDRSIDINNKRTYGEDGKGIYTNIKNYAEGGEVKDDGLAVVSEGETIVDKVARKAKEIFTFVDGKVIKYRIDKEGEPVLDTSDSDTSKNLEEIEQEKETQRGIFEKLTNATDSILGRIKSLFGSEDEDSDKSDKEGGFFSKIKSFLSGKGGSLLGTVIGVPLLVGFWKEKIWPKLEPILTELFPEFKSTTEGLKTKISDVADDLLTKVQHWLGGTNEYEGRGLPKVIENSINYWGGGFEIIMSKIVPKAAEIIITSLPSIVTGIVKGVGNLLDISISTLLRGTRPSTSVDDVADNMYANSSTSTQSVIGSLTSINGNPGKLQGENGTNNFPGLGNWSLNNDSFNLSASSTNTSDLFDNNSDSSSSSSTTTSSGSRDTSDQLSQEMYGTNYIGLTADQRAEVRELANSKVKKNASIDDKNYTAQQLYGTTYNKLTDDQKADVIGVLSGTKGVTSSGTVYDYVSDAERKANSETLVHRTSLGEGIATTALKAFTHRNGSTTWLGKAGNALSKSPIAKTATHGLGAILKGTDTVITSAGKLGNKILPENPLFGFKSVTETAESASSKGGRLSRLASTIKKGAGDFLTGRDTVEVITGSTGSSVADNIYETMSRSEAIKRGFTDAAEYTVTHQTGTSKVVDAVNSAKNRVVSKVDDVVGEVGSKAASKLDDIASNGILGKVSKHVTSAVSKLFGNSKVINKFAEVAKALGGNMTKEAAQKVAKEFGEKITKKLVSKLGETIAESVGKVAAKLAGGALTAGVINVASAVIAFIDGYNDANSVLGLVDSVSKPSFLTKLLSGIVAALNDFCCLGLLPIPIIVDVALPLLNSIPAFSKYTEQLIEDREKSADIVAEDNARWNTDLTVEEYNDVMNSKKRNGIIASIIGQDAYIDKDGNYVAASDGLVQKAGSAIKNLPQTVKTGAKTLFDEITGHAFNDDALREKFGVDDDYKITLQDRVSSFIGERLGGMFNDKDFTAQVDGTITKIKEGVKGGLNTIDTKIGSALGMEDDEGNPLTITEGIKFNLDKTKEKLKQGWVDFKGDTKEFFSNIAETATEKYENYKTGVSAGLKVLNIKFGSMLGLEDDKGNSLTVTEGIKFKIDKQLETFKEGWSNIKTGAKEFIDDTYDKVSKKFKEFKEGIDKALDVVNDVLGAAFGMVDENGKAMSLSEGITYNWDKFKKSLSDTWTNIKNGAGNLWDSITGWFSDAVETSAETHKSGSGSGLSASGSGIAGRFVGSGSIGTSQLTTEMKKSGAFVSQLDPKYANKTFNTSADTTRQTIASDGCAPAAATMAVNGTLQNTSPTLSMTNAARSALNYKEKDGGVNANYFSDVFSRNGLRTDYYIDSNTKNRNSQIVSSLSSGNQVVLMGQDSSNNSKSISPFGPQSHYVVATGLSKDGKYMYINDPEAKTANIKYPTKRILSSTRMGVSGVAASGSKLLNKTRKLLANFVGSSTLPGSSVAEQAWNFLKSNGFTDEAAAGLLGNFQQESSMRPDNIQGNGKGPAAGLYQMETYGDYSTRWGRMAQLAESRGKDWTDLESQLLFLLEDAPGQFKNYTGQKKGSGAPNSRYADENGRHWYKNGEWAWWPDAMTFDEFKTINDIAKATEVFERVFERAGTPQMENRIKYAQQYYNQFSGKYTQVTGASYSSDTTNSSSSSSSSGTVLDKVLGSFDNLAAAYGLTSSSSSSSSPSSSSSTSTTGSSLTGGTGNATQQALVNEMASWENKLSYSMEGPRNPEKGSADCSSTVNYVYKKITGKTVGDYTGAMMDNSNTETVDEGDGSSSSKPDKSKLQPGDILLFWRQWAKDAGRNPAVGHVEMYMGDGKQMGHGGPGNGPVFKELQGNFLRARRLKGIGSASGSGLVGSGSGAISKMFNRSGKVSNNVRNPEKSVTSVRYDIKNLDKGVNLNAVAAGSEIQSPNTNTISKETGINITKLAQTTYNETSLKKKSVEELLVIVIKYLSNVANNTGVLGNILSIVTALFNLEQEQAKFNNEKATMNDSVAQATQSGINAKRSSLLAALNSANRNNYEDSGLARLINEVNSLAIE